MANDSDRLLVQQIRQGDAGAWEALIARYEGRLLAFVDRRLRDRAASEDVVQETFVGFLNSLPNFDDSRERLFGLPIGRTVHSLDEFLQTVHPDDRARVAATYERSASAGDFGLGGDLASWSSARTVRRKRATGMNSDIHASPEYRAHLVGVLARRAVAKATA